MKAIDAKYHIEGEQIIKTSNGQAVPDDEPKFLFRGRDRLLLPALMEYRKACILDGCTSYQVRILDQKIQEIREWQKANLDKLKQPGCTEGR